MGLLTLSMVTSRSNTASEVSILLGAFDQSDLNSIAQLLEWYVRVVALDSADPCSADILQYDFIPLVCQPSK